VKILLVTTVVPSPTLVTNAARAVNLPGASFDLLSLDPPIEPLAVGTHLVVDRSLVPRRPLTRASTTAAKAPPQRGLRQKLRGALRRGRAGVHRLPLPERWRASPGRMLAIACRTTPAARKLAERADVVVALDDPSCWGVWELSRRTSGPRFVNRPGNVAQVLSAPRPAT
jgi:hypothetical protein